jgi:hypothetical protein
VELFNIKTDFDGLVWYARPQLFFNCTFCPTGLKATMHSGSHKEVSLVYFSTFEPIDLTLDSIMQRAGVPMLYDSASNQRLPCLYICPVANVMGRAPLSPCFIGGNSHPTMPHRFKDDQRIRHASNDIQLDRGNGSRLYEVNIWMWRYGRGAPGWCLSSRRRGSGPSGSARAGPGRQRRGSVTARPLPQRWRHKAAVERIEHWPMIS